MTLRPEDVRDIVAILDSTAYDTLTVRTDRFEVSLRRGAEGWSSEATPLAEPSVLEPPAEQPPPAATGPEGPFPAAGDTVRRAGAAAPHPGPSPAAGDTEEGLVAVPAPVVGTFYRSPRPGAPPFVEVGDHVEPDTVVGIIETMKLMTSVPAGLAGTVRQICVGNDEFAEQGATLLRIAPG